MSRPSDKPARFEVFGLRDFRLLYVASTVSYVGNTFTTVALALGVLAATGSVTAVGIVVAARQVAHVVFVLFGGAWGDRVSRRTLMVVSYVGAAATQAAMAALLLADAGTTWNLAAIAVVNGAVLAVLGPAASSVLPQLIPARLLQQANAFFSITRSSANIGGAVLAGLLVAATEPGWALAVDAATFLVAALLIASIPPTPAKANRSGLLHELREGWREFIARTWVWSIVLQFSILGMGYAAAFLVYTPVIAKNDLGGPHSYGLIVGAFGVGAVLGGLLMLRLSPTRPMITATAGIFVAIAVFAALAAGLPLWLVMLAAVASGIGLETFSVLWSSTLQAQVPDELLSRVSAYDFLGSLVFTPLGAALAGPLAGALGGLHPAMWVAVATMAIPTLLVLAVPDVWRLRTR